MKSEIPRLERDRLTAFIQRVLPSIDPDIHAELMDAFRAGYAAGHTDGYDRGVMDGKAISKAEPILPVPQVSSRGIGRALLSSRKQPSYLARLRRLYNVLPCLTADIPDESRMLLPGLEREGRIRFCNGTWERV